MVDKSEIAKEFNEFYITSPGLNIDIDNDGKITVNGNCFLRDGMFVLANLQIKKVTGDFWCDNQRLETLNGSPNEVLGSFICANNNLKNLEYAPTRVGAILDAAFNQLENLQGAPKHIGGRANFEYNPLTSFDGAPELINGTLTFTWHVALPLLSLLKIKGVTEFECEQLDVGNILNKYYPYGINGIIPCAAALAKAGYRGNARL